MVLNVFDNNAWHFLTQVVSTIGDNGYIDIIIPEFGKFTPATIYNYYDGIDGYFNLVVIESDRAKTTYLNDFFSDALQSFLTYFGFFNIPKNIKNIRFAQEQLYDCLFIFVEMSESGYQYVCYYLSWKHEMISYSYHALMLHFSF